MIRLLVNTYKSDSQARQAELDICLEKNMALPFLTVHDIQPRPTYNDYFHTSSKLIHDEDFDNDDIFVIANSDIYFDETILYARFMNESNCYALSRWDLNEDNLAVLFNRKDSQDAWIFNGIPNVRGGEFQLGQRGCDNRIAFDIKQSGYNVLNPSKTIHAIHIHLTGLRTYTAQTPAIPEPYHFIHPHF